MKKKILSITILGCIIFNIAIVSSNSFLQHKAKITHVTRGALFTTASVDPPYKN